PPPARRGSFPSAGFPRAETPPTRAWPPSSAGDSAARPSSASASRSSPASTPAIRRPSPRTRRWGASGASRRKPGACTRACARDGFGFVVPRTEKSPIAACAFPDRKFAGRVPPGGALFRVFVGGAFGREAYAMDDRDLLRAAEAELRRLLGIAGEPLFRSLRR